MGGSAPDTPSAGETGAANRETARYNTEMSFVDQYTPNGNYIYSMVSPGDGDKIPPRYRLDTNLSGTGQAKQDGLDRIQLALLGLGEGQLGRVSDAMGKPLADATQSRDAATQNAMKYLTYGMDDRYSRQQGDLENQLAAQGIRPGSAAYQQAMGDFGSSKNEAYERAGLQAYNTGLTEMQNMTQLEAYNRSLPLNELAALISGTQVQGPQFTQVQTAQVPYQPYSAPGGGSNMFNDIMSGARGITGILGSFLS